MLLKLENIGKIYNSNDILTIGIRGINLELDYNEFVTIEGESGSGKSTLLNVIGANDSYEEGELYLNGRETSHYTEDEWEKYREKNIATIFQDFNIIENLTVLENVELALLRIDDKRERRRIARALIEKVGLTRQSNQRGSRLSGGEKQRTVIARALAKDAPVILADEPTGNLDVKASREIARLLKDVSKDKLVIVVTHNPEFFKEYATRRIRIYDGGISEDTLIASPAPYAGGEGTESAPSRGRNLRNTLHIGVLNYKSRPRFTVLVSCALFVCAVAVYLILGIFHTTLIRPLTTTLEDAAVEGKVVVFASEDNITSDELDEIAAQTGAGYFFVDRSLTSFEVAIAKSKGMLSSYTVTCLYAPYEHPVTSGSAVLSLPASARGDAQAIADVFLNAGVGIQSVSFEISYTSNAVRLYVSYDDLVGYGAKMKAVNSTMRIEGSDNAIYTFAVGEGLAVGEVSLVNSTYWDVLGKSVVLSALPGRAYTVADDTQEDAGVSGIVVYMNAEDYEAAFEGGVSSGNQACLYFASDRLASSALSAMPEGYLGLLSQDSIYVQGAEEVFAQNVGYYVALIAVCLLLGLIISIIFTRSVKIYQADFAVYRTLGISAKTSSRSLYIQMLLIFLPTLALLPLISLAVTVLPGLGFTFIGAGDYLFIELMLLLVVEIVAYCFNKSLRGQSIRKTLRRGNK